jgi:hypothetical protein
MPWSQSLRNMTISGSIAHEAAYTVSLKILAKGAIGFRLYRKHWLYHFMSTQLVFLLFSYLVAHKESAGLEFRMPI